MAIAPGGEVSSVILQDDALRELASQRWYGKANRLSRDEPVPWPAIEEVAAASRKA